MNESSTVGEAELEAIHAYWRAANYLTVGQIYLLSNELLREPLRAEHIKPRLLGHSGTSPGQSLVYARRRRSGSSPVIPNPQPATVSAAPPAPAVSNGTAAAASPAPAPLTN